MRAKDIELVYRIDECHFAEDGTRVITKLTPISAAPTTPALREAVEGLRTSWDALCRCTDEFDGYPGACDERQQDLYSAVERVLAVPKNEES